MSCQLYLISPPSFDTACFKEQLRSALATGGVGAFQLRLKDMADDDILRAAEELLPLCREADVVFILNDRPDLALKCGADGVHLGQEDLQNLLEHETSAGARVSLEPASCDLQERITEANKQHPFLSRDRNVIREVRKMLGEDAVIGITAHASRHLAMEAGEQGADYVAFGAFHPTTSKPQEKIDKWGTPTMELIEWWSENTVLPCVAIGGMTPDNCGACVRAGADFIAVITAIWGHPQSPAKAVAEFNTAIEEAIAIRRSA